ncbi:MAG: MFS transporter [Proteobacteria bacterium]|nr:MFS transporter [Pseudomonadota bacterium]
MSAPPSYLELLINNKPFRWLWLGQVVSFFGDWFKTIALFTIVQGATGSATAIAAVIIAKMLPIFLVVPIAGPLIDRFDRRILLLVTDVVRAALVLMLIVAHWLHNLTLLYAILVVQVCFTGVFIPARTAVVPQLTTREELPVAIALSSGSWSVMLAFGAAAGGVVTHLMGVENALILDSMSYLLSALFLFQLPSLPPRSSGESGDASFAEGLRHLKARPFLAALLAQKSMLALAGGAVVMLPLYGNGLFAATAGPLFIGLLYALRGVGALLGSMGIRPILGDAPRTMERLVAPGFLILSIGLVVVYFAPSIWWAAAGFCLSSIGTGVVWVMSGTLSQLASEQAYRGRIFSMEWGAFTLTSSVVSWLAGYVVDSHGCTPRLVMGVSAGLMLLPAIGWLVVLKLARRHQWESMASRTIVETVPTDVSQS